ncbi:hypothetical protein NB706_003551 [Xanthomonas sacchari]|nr:hypothetical protein [Xanthomonas sacchari]
MLSALLANHGAVPPGARPLAKLAYSDSDGRSLNSSAACGRNTERRVRRVRLPSRSQARSS